MGDLLDSILDLKGEMTDIGNEFKSMGDEIVGRKDVVRTDVKAPWNPKAYADEASIAYDQCPRHRSDKAACRACADICPEHALSFDEGDVVIDTELCRGCGLCAAVCPTDALALKTNGPTALLKNLAERADKTEVCYVTCSQVRRKTTPDERIAVLPCLGILTPEVLFALLVDHPNIAIYQPVDACAHCRWKAGEKLYTDAIEAAEQWSGYPVGFECSRRELKLGANRATERRDFVKNTATQLGGAALRSNPATRTISKAADLLTGGNPLDILGERFGAFIKDPSADVKMSIGSNRAVLLAAIDKHRVQAARVKVIVSKTVADACVGCRTCVKACPMGARRIVDGVAVVDRRLCADCGLCAEVCEHDAVARVRINGRTLVGLSAKPEKTSAEKITRNVMKSTMQAVGFIDGKKADDGGDGAADSEE